MWSLYARYYGGTSEAVFRADLATKTHVILAHDADGRIGGFTTIELTEHEYAGETLRILYSGDTIVDHRYWARNDIAFRWIRFASAVQAQLPEAPLFWLLIVKGHRTYRYLSVFGRRYYPAPGTATPAREQTLIDSLATARFGDAYQSHTGVVHFNDSRGFLKPEWAEVPSTTRQRPEVAFFLERNPGYRSGDELVCLCEVATHNMKPLTRRVFSKALPEDAVLL